MLMGIGITFPGMIPFEMHTVETLALFHMLCFALRKNTGSVATGEWQIVHCQSVFRPHVAAGVAITTIHAMPLIQSLAIDDRQAALTAAHRDSGLRVGRAA